MEKNLIIFVDVDETVRTTADTLLNLVKEKYNDEMIHNGSWDITFESGKNFMEYYNTELSVQTQARVVPNANICLHYIYYILGLKIVFISVQTSDIHKKLTTIWLNDNFVDGVISSNRDIVYVPSREEKLNYISSLKLPYAPILLDDFGYTEKDLKNKNIKFIKMKNIHNDGGMEWGEDLVDEICDYYWDME